MILKETKETMRKEIEKMKTKMSQQTEYQSDRSYIKGDQMKIPKLQVK